MTDQEKIEVAAQALIEIHLWELAFNRVAADLVPWFSVECTFLGPNPIVGPNPLGIALDLLGVSEHDYWEERLMQLAESVEPQDLKGDIALQFIATLKAEGASS